MNSFTASGRRWRFLLVASLALNLLLVAAIGAHYIRAATQKPADRWKDNLEMLAQSLPATDAAKFRTVLGQRMPVLEGGRGQSRAARDAIGAAIRAEPFDRAALERAMAGFAGRLEENQKNYYGMIAETAAALSPEGRAKMAEWLTRRR